MKIKVFLYCLTAAVLFCQPAGAQSSVSGNRYQCYIISPLDVVGSEIVFDEKGALSFSAFQGTGQYSLIGSLFTGSYWTLNATIGSTQGDVIFLMLGRAPDYYITGTGIMLLEYSRSTFFILFGTRVLDE